MDGDTLKAKQAVEELANITGLEKTSKTDVIRNSVIAAIAGIPFVGGTMASLAEDFIPSQKEKKLIAFIAMVSQDVEDIKDKINFYKINTDEFAFVFEKTLKGVIDNWQKEKIDCYRAIFVNALTNNNDISDEEQELFIQMLDSLTVRHIKIMAFINKQNSCQTPPSG